MLSPKTTESQRTPKAHKQSNITKQRYSNETNQKDDCRLSWVKSKRMCLPFYIRWRPNWRYFCVYILRALCCMPFPCLILFGSNSLNCMVVIHIITFSFSFSFSLDFRLEICDFPIYPSNYYVYKVHTAKFVIEHLPEWSF